MCEESKLRGDITIGAGTIIHPSAVIIAEAGPIIIGEHCLIEEQAKIIHRFVHLLVVNNFALLLNVCKVVNSMFFSL